MTRHDNVRIGARSCPELPSLILYLRAATCNSQNVHSNGRAFHVNATSALCATRLKVTHWLRRACAGSQPCTKDTFAAQIPVLTGTWVNSTNDTFSGFYTMAQDCPTWARDYDCKNPTQTGEAKARHCKG